MTSAFYLTATPSYGGTWYQLLTRKTHFCISCGTDLERIIEVLKSYVKNFRTEQKMLDGLERLDCGGRVSPATFEQREEYFREHGEDYGDLVHSIVKETLAEALAEDKANSPLNKTKNRLRKAGVVKSTASRELSPHLDPIPVKQEVQVIKGKPRLFNRK